jgi:AhpD family alkylhydroperoxidase
MKATTTLSLIFMTALSSASALAEGPPRFYKDTFPQHALNSMMAANKALTGAEAKLEAKTRELIALGVAAQIPCAYCVYVHNKKARDEGASEAEIREAVATAAHVRHWSTVLNGMAYDLNAFKAEVDGLLASK